MIIDRISDCLGGFTGWDTDAMTSPLNLCSFYGSSSPPGESCGSAGYQSPWSPNSDSEKSWSDQRSPGCSGAQNFHADNTVVRAGQTYHYQGVRVRKTVKELIMQKKLITGMQAQHHQADNDCPVLTAILQKRAADPSSPVPVPTKRCATSHNSSLPPSYPYVDDSCLFSAASCDFMCPAPSIDSVRVQDSPQPTAISIQGQQPLQALMPNGTADGLYPPCSVPGSLENLCISEIQAQNPQLNATDRPTKPPVSFFEWQIRQEEEKLSGLTAEQLTSRDADGDTFLHIAVAQGRRALAYVLAKKMAEIRMLDIKEHNSQSALQVSVAANQHLIAQDLLLLGAQVNTADCWGRSPLHVCAEKGHALTLQAILKALQISGQQLNVEAVNYEGMTPLHTAVMSHNAVVQELGQAAVPLSPQSVALAQRRKLLGECVQTLLLMGASCGTKDCKSGRTALHMAAEEANVELLRLFLDHPQSLSFINLKAYNGNTVLHVASALTGRVAQVDAVRLLMRRGADPSAKNLENEQPAQLVPEGDLGDQVRRILKGRGAQARPLC
ncbi:NF-kappa-B inhibitor zeta [Denticeps clupeoides]|uniref:OCA domain-containing protein n=1 Tax=Denticeps clupeoides TaxID=299321 RepID=A0AAY4EXC3_9TELE|nr:NF-kappa-B inhibitor zeta [Denticeps clupeoides]